MINPEDIQQKIRNRQYAEADQLLESALKREPDHADFYYLRGLLRSFQGKLTSSIDDLKYCLKLDTKHTDAAVCLSVLLNDIGHYDEAKIFFEKANQSVFLKQAGDDLQIDQRFSAKHLELGDLYFRHRRFDEAIEEYNKAITLNPEPAEVRIKRAKAFAKKGFISRAIQDLQQLKVERPSEPMIGVQLGLLHYSQGNLLDAQLEWESVLEIDPVNREAIAYIDLIKRS